MKKVLSIIIVGLFISLFSPKASAECTVVLIMNMEMPLVSNNVNISINNQHVCDMELTLKRQVNDSYVYKKAVKKLIFNKEDKYIISYDLIQYGNNKRHSDIVIDAIDGETYYLNLLSGRFAFKQISEKDAMKKLKKTKDYVFLPDYVYTEE